MAEVVKLPERDPIADATSQYRKLIVDFGPNFVAGAVLAVADALPLAMQRHLTAALVNTEPRLPSPENEATAALVADFRREGDEIGEMNLYCLAKALPEAERNVVLVELLRRYCLVQKPAP